MKHTSNYTPHLSTIESSQFFSRISSEDLVSALDFLRAQVRTYSKNEIILRLGDPFLYAGIVLAGTVEGSFISESYNKININHFEVGRMFGESLACVRTPNSPIELRALSDCTLLMLDLHVLFSAESLPEPYQQTLAINLTQILSRLNVFTNLKLRIASQKALRDKVLMYFQSLTPDEDGMRKVPFTQTALAEFLGVNRSALSRELGRMVDEGLIDMPARGRVVLL